MLQRDSAVVCQSLRLHDIRENQIIALLRLWSENSSACKRVSLTKIFELRLESEDYDGDTQIMQLESEFLPH